MLTRALAIVASTALIASGAAAAPQSLSQGNWSLGHAFFDDTNVQLGIGVADMTRILVSAGFRTSSESKSVQFSPPDTTSSTFDSATDYSFGIGLLRYLSGMSSDRFAPFLGAGIGVTQSGDSEFTSEGPSGTFTFRNEQDPDFEVEGRFGAEVFFVEALSISGFVGMRFNKFGDAVNTQSSSGVETRTESDGSTSLNTLRSGVTATFYWGGEE